MAGSDDNGRALTGEGASHFFWSDGSDARALQLKKSGAQVYEAVSDGEQSGGLLSTYCTSLFAIQR